MSKEIAAWIGPLIALAIVAWRMNKHSKGGPLNPKRLWIRPAILALFLALAALHPPKLTLLAIIVLPAAAVAGLGLGTLLASHQALTIDEEGKITSRMSPVGIALFIGLFIARSVFRVVTTGGEASGKLMAHSDQILLYTDAGLVFVLALVAAQTWEIKRRVKPLLASHAAKRAESQEK